MEIETYRILEKIGQGAMGKVYRAESQQGEILVLKEYDRSEGDPNRIARFRREAEICATLRHENIVRVFRMFSWKKKDYIAMEFLPGVTLAEHAKIGTDAPDRGLPMRDALRYGLQMAAALGYAHRRKIVHRDVKPGNIMLVDGAKRCVLTDFGVARISQSSLTQPGSVLGTPQYMAPEQIRDTKNVDRRTDVYGLGITLYSAISGDKPFAVRTMKDLFAAVLHTPLPPLSKGTPLLEEFLRKMTEKKPNQRFQSMEEVGAAMLALLEDPDISPPPPPPKRRWWRFFR